MKSLIPFFIFLLCILAAAISIYIPKIIADRGDNGFLNKIQTGNSSFSSGVYRYSMTEGEKLYILAKSLANRSILQSDHAAYVRSETSLRTLDSAFTYIANANGAAANEIKAESVIETLNNQIKKLADNGIFTYIKIPEEDYDYQLYNAIDILDPQRNISVWQISYNKPIQQLSKKDVLIEAYMDTQTGKLYCFSYRTANKPDFFNEDTFISVWCEYIGLSIYEPDTAVSPLAEMTPHFKKYTAGGADASKTTVTIGYYEGINEVFLKIE